MKELTFEEIKKLYGEEAAINAGIAADPDTFRVGRRVVQRGATGEGSATPSFSKIRLAD